MGIFLNFHVIPKRIAPDKWESVYEEALKIANGCRLLDRVPAERNGRKYAVGKMSEERDVFGKGLGFNVCGTMESGFDMEDFPLYRNLEYYSNWDKAEKDDGIDVIFSGYYAEDGGVPTPNCSHNIWGGKTQGCLGHIPLLGIACLFAERFPDAVTVSGDISAGQCRTATEFVSQFLDSPIGPPVICRPLPLAERIRTANISAQQRLTAFFEIYLGSLTADVGNALREVFSSDDLYGYFRDKFAQTNPDDYDFMDNVRDYLLLGFDFSDLIKMLVSDSSGGKLSLESVLTKLFSYKIHIPFEEKNTYDPGDFSNTTRGDESGLGSIGGMLGRAFFRMAAGRNKTLPVFVSLETIKKVCREFDDDGDALIDRILSEQAEDQVQEKAFGKDKGSLLDMIEQKTAEMQEEESEKQKYDIGELQDIFTHKVGDSIEPKLEESLIRAIQQIQKFDLEDDFQAFLARDRVERENTFITQNRYILIWESTWEHIFAHIMDDDYIRRYYHLFRVDCSGQNTSRMIESLLSNPAFIDWLWDKASKLSETE